MAECNFPKTVFLNPCVAGLLRSGWISLKDWAVAMETVFHLALPWRVLRSQLVSTTKDGMLDYQSWFKELAIMEPNKEVSTHTQERCIGIGEMHSGGTMECVHNVKDQP